MNESFFKNKKVVVTGHTGFKGAWLTNYLHLLGAKVMGISLQPSTKPSLFRILKLDTKIKSNFINILEKNKIEKKILKFKPDVIFHLAAQAIIKKSYEIPLETWKTNLFGTINLLDSIKKQKKNVFVLL